MFLLPFFFSNLLFMSLVVAAARRNHIEVSRPSSVPTLEVSGLATRGVTLWTTGNNLRVSLKHNNVDIIPDTRNPDVYDVYVNDDFAYCCTLKLPRGSAGILLYIIKDGSHLRIAPSPVSICVPAWRVESVSDDVQVRPKSKSTPLRVSLLRGMAFKQIPNSESE